MPSLGPEQELLCPWMVYLSKLPPPPPKLPRWPSWEAKPGRRAEGRV